MLTPSPSALEIGLQALDRIHERYMLPSGLYAEYAPGARDRQPAFNWAVGVMLSALNAGAKATPRYRPILEAYADGIEVYWNPVGPVPGYDVLPWPKPTDRYYDDNAWMVISLLETGEILDAERFVDRAERTLIYVLSGESDRLGGGIYWRESDKASKNTCSNAPSASAALLVYAKRPKPEYLAAAKRLYEWTRTNLRDPSDGLMWDNMSLDGTVEKTKWSYNTALMIRASRLLYETTKQTRFRDESIHFARAAVRHWIDPQTGLVRCEAAFAHLLLETLWEAEDAFGIDLVDTPKTIAALSRLANAEGFFPNRFDRPPGADQTRFGLLPQASFARALLLGAMRQ